MSAPTTPSPVKQKKSKRKQERETTPAQSDSTPSDSNVTSDLPTTTEADPEAAEAEVEVLSHAAQRKAKKRKLKEVISGENDDEELDSKASKPNSKPQSQTKAPPVRQNSVWVGNLSFKTTEAQIKEFFEGVGEISRIHMPKKLDVGNGRGMRGENRGFAYVDFSTPDAQTLAITLSERNLDGRRLLIKNGDDFTGRPDAPKTTPVDDEKGAPANQSSTSAHSKTAQKILRAQKQPAAQTLFMGNLPFETKEDDIRQMIEGHGLPSDLEEQAKKDGAAKNPGGKPLRWLKKIRLGTFEDSGLCKGWAFLDFINTSYATAVLVNIRNHHLNGRKLVLEYGSPDAVRRGGGGPRPRKAQAETEQSEETPRAAKKRKIMEANTGINEDEQESTEAKEQPQKRAPKGDEQYVRARDGRLRPKPGAALAMAKREAVAIVPSAGKKIVF
ncbi:RNA-binding domain-containing protein [Ceratobasidium sp. AG-I]|nr:RNA-binding domain-containing protein [Ceratobasidium sp. AG-I]